MKDQLEKKKIKIVEFAKALGISPSQASLYVNNWVSIPKKYQEKIKEILGEKKATIGGKKE